VADTDAIEPVSLSTETVAERRARLGADRVEPSGRGRRIALVVAGGVLGLAAVVGAAGFPGPEPFHRSSIGSLRALETRINDASRTAQDACGTGTVREPASIDWLSGRVVVHAGGLPPVALTQEEWSIIQPPVYHQPGNGFC